MEFAKFRFAPPVGDGGGVGAPALAVEATAVATVAALAAVTAVATGVATGDAVGAAGRTGAGAAETGADGAEGIGGAEGMGGVAICGAGEPPNADPAEYPPPKPPDTGGMGGCAIGG